MKKIVHKYYNVTVSMQISAYFILFLLVLSSYVVAESIDLAMNDSKLVDNDEEFEWEWGSDEGRGADTSSAKLNNGSQKVNNAVDASAYNDLVAENLKLRQRVAEKERLAKEAQQKASSLSKEQNILEARIKSLATTINDIEKEKNNLTDNTERFKVLAEKLSQAEKSKKDLAAQMSEMKKELKELHLKEQSISTGSATGVVAGSDLFEKLKEDNTQLKTKLSALEKEHNAVVKERDKIKNKEDNKVAKAKNEVDELKDMLKASKTGDEEQKKLINKLLEKLPAMEEELKSLREKVGGDEVMIASREQELANVKEELRLRERRLIKAERMAAMLDQVREEVRTVSDEQERDMHYNMAVVYAKEGKSKQAEEEYLQSLRIDPMDAASHYNLAILYDDELNNKNRALIHYRRYLKLRPNATDYEEVRHWIMALEMR